MTSYSSEFGSGATSLGDDRPRVETTEGPTSLGALFGQVTNDLSTLVRQEVALAKAEIKQDASRAGKGAGMLGGAGFAGYFVLLFLSLALMYWLNNAMDTGWAALIVAVIWGVVGAVLAVVGKSQLAQLKGPQQTVATAKEIPPALKPNS
ncbi:putative superfamily III holin-X [Motilibacter rhizosphaerae]|uniref:Putative superfamily III holin-X n=1 Tax=Motilibacter rhizosphaerae TaxID=598652 RepID=A0A4Q7NVD5_9ACTN|nr:phage holin family protein [Motilibacter rhizosphaerae]RZS90828.1 putative superfamily III holin-X [Motilibacter rhizosphaerae]